MVKVYKNVCITGAGNGIGRAIAIAMSNEGYNVTCADIDLQQKLNKIGFKNVKVFPPGIKGWRKIIKKD